jgi:Uma2 family endonuclease
MQMSEVEYMRVEEAAQGRHEYVAGRMFAMSGASGAHNRIVMNLAYHLYNPVDAGGCFMAASDMKVKVQVLGAIYYPDIVISCEAKAELPDVLTAPCLIVEVLSRSTMSIDRREKLMAYQTIPSVKEYLLVRQDRRQIDLFRKNASNEWELEAHKDSDVIRLTTFEHQVVELKLDDVYHRVFPNSKS